MAFKEKFNVEDWNLLQLSLLWVFDAVAGADNKIDKKETRALQSLVESSGKFFNDLAREVFMDLKNNFDTFKSEYMTSGKNYTDELIKIKNLLEEKIDSEIALNFKKTLIAIGVYIGHSSGNLFGSKLSEDEIKQVEKIGDLLGVSVSDLQKPPDLQQIIQHISA